MCPSGHVGFRMQRKAFVANFYLNVYTVAFLDGNAIICASVAPECECRALGGTAFEEKG